MSEQPNREKVKAWITTYALTKGIMQEEGEIDHNIRSERFSYYGGQAAAYDNNWHRTREAAVKRAEEMRMKKIASVEKQLEKLKKMRFE